MILTTVHIILIIDGKIHIIGYKIIMTCLIRPIIRAKANARAKETKECQGGQGG